MYSNLGEEHRSCLYTRIMMKQQNEHANVFTKLTRMEGRIIIKIHLYSQNWYKSHKMKELKKLNKVFCLPNT